MSSMAPTALFAEPVSQLHEAIDRLAQEDLELVPASGLGDDLRGLRSAIERMEAEFSRRSASTATRATPPAATAAPPAG